MACFAEIKLVHGPKLAQAPESGNMQARHLAEALMKQQQNSVTGLPASTDSAGADQSRSAPVRPFWQALVTHVAEQARTLPVPAIRHLELPPASPTGTGRNNFAALVLADGTVGLTYVALDDALAGLRAQAPAGGPALTGQSPLALLAHYEASTGWQRSLGMAAINAISQYVLAAGAPLEPMPDTLAMLAIKPGEHIGMVGFFGRLVRPILAAGARLTVIELDPSLTREEPGLSVTLDHRQLRTCTSVIVTGTTLLNASLDTVLGHCAPGAQVNLLGPSASCLAEPLFARGVTRVGGFQVRDTEAFLALWRGGQRWRDAGLRYQLIAPAGVAAGAA